MNIDGSGLKNITNTPEISEGGACWAKQAYDSGSIFESFSATNKH